MSTANQDSFDSIWTGRADNDGDPELNLRWHQAVQQYSDDPGSAGLALVGFACDEGVRRNHGRPGAAEGPDGIRRCLANMSWNRQDCVYDMGNIPCLDENLESAQTDFSQAITQALNDGLLPIGLGGGHEIAWGSYKGLVDHLVHHQKSTKDINIGVINFDAHFDMRKPEKGSSSGTPFWQMAEYCTQQKLPFHYMCLGVSRASNTQVLFDRADEMGVVYLTDDEISLTNLDTLIEDIDCFSGMVDHIYLTVCLDAFPAYMAPGVSAPAARGISLEMVERLLMEIKNRQKIRIIDVAEYNPRFDRDNQTARLAARLIHTLTMEPEA